MQFGTHSDHVWNLVSGCTTRASGTYISANKLAGLLEMLLPLTLAFLIVGRVSVVARILLGYAALAMTLGLTVTFSRDARGHASLCVTGQGQSDETLRALGEELSQAVVQQYVYQKLMDEMRARGFNVVEEKVNEDRSIRLKVRHWEN